MLFLIWTEKPWPIGKMTIFKICKDARISWHTIQWNANWCSTTKLSKIAGYSWKSILKLHMNLLIALESFLSRLLKSYSPTVPMMKTMMKLSSHKREIVQLLLISSLKTERTSQKHPTLKVKLNIKLFWKCSINKNKPLLKKSIFLKNRLKPSQVS